jgi:alkanesulfonate monooxygenase
MKNTDSAWKQRLRRMADVPVEAGSPYWLSPFRNFQADCPYLVGSHMRVAEVIANLAARGVDTFILDVPSSEQEFRHVQAAFALAQRQPGRAAVSP